MTKRAKTTKNIPDFMKEIAQHDWHSRNLDLLDSCQRLERDYVAPYDIGLQRSPDYYGHIPPRPKPEKRHFDLSSLIQERDELLAYLATVSLENATPETLAKWGRLNFIRGVQMFAHHIDDDAMQKIRAGRSNEAAKGIDEKLSWVCKVVSSIRAEQGCSRVKAEGHLVDIINHLDSKTLPDPRFGLEWYESLVNESGLRGTYTSKHLPNEEFEQLASKPSANIPTTDLSLYKQLAP